MVTREDDDNVVSTPNKKPVQRAIKNLLTGFDSVLPVKNDYGDTFNNLELCVISLPPNIPLSSLNNINVTYNSVERKSLENANGNQLAIQVSCKNVRKQSVWMKTMSDSMNTMVIKKTQNSIDFTEFAPVTLPDMNNCIPRPAPPIMPDVEVRFKPFGWQDPIDQQSPIKQKRMLPKKKHKRKIKFDFNCSTSAGDYQNSVSSSYPAKKKKDKTFQLKESWSPLFSNSTHSVNETVENVGQLSTITSKESPKKKKRKKDKEENSIYFPLSSQTEPVLPLDGNTTYNHTLLSTKHNHKSSKREKEDNVVSSFPKVVGELKTVDLENIKSDNNEQANFSIPLQEINSKKKKKAKSVKTEKREDDTNYPSVPEVLPKSTKQDSQCLKTNAKTKKSKKKKHKNKVIDIL